MLLIMQADQMAYPDVERVARYFQKMPAQVFVTGPEESRFVIDGMVALMELSGSRFYSEPTLESRMKLYSGIIEDEGESSESTIILSNCGTDLAAAILMGTDFMWGFDVS